MKKRYCSYELQSNPFSLFFYPNLILILPSISSIVIIEKSITHTPYASSVASDMIIFKPHIRMVKYRPRPWHRVKESFLIKSNNSLPESHFSNSYSKVYYMIYHPFVNYVPVNRFTTGEIVRCQS